jgi:hypothetical protein
MPSLFGQRAVIEVFDATGSRVYMPNRWVRSAHCNRSTLSR